MFAGHRDVQQAGQAQAQHGHVTHVGTLILNANQQLGEEGREDRQASRDDHYQRCQGSIVPLEYVHVCTCTNVDTSASTSV